MNFGKQQQRSTEFILDSDPFENIFYSLVVQDVIIRLRWDQRRQQKSIFSVKSNERYIDILYLYLILHIILNNNPSKF